MNKLTLILHTLLVLVVAPAVLSAQIIRAVFLNPPSTDNGQEYYEIYTATPNTSLDGYTILHIEGDNGGNPGDVDNIISLNGLSTGSNGLLLYRDAATVLSPAPSAETSVHVADFTPDLENASTTILLVQGFTGNDLTDIDADNDGIVDPTPPWSGTPASAIGISDGGATDIFYGAALGGVNFPKVTGVDEEFIFFIDGEYFLGDITGTSPGPYTINNGEVINTAGTIVTTYNGATMTPGGTVAPLPILIDRFETQSFDQEIVLLFSTKTEINNNFFAIERSVNGINFNEIGQVKGAGTTSTPSQYTFTDHNPVKGTNYYRLRQVDLDGQFTYSHVVAAQYGKQGGVLVFPTAANAAITVQLEEVLENDANWEILDMSGRIMQQGTLVAEQQQIEIGTGDLATGAYIVRIIAGQAVMTTQFRKQ